MRKIVGRRPKLSAAQQLDALRWANKRDQLRQELRELGTMRRKTTASTSCAMYVIANSTSPPPTTMANGITRCWCPYAQNAGRNRDERTG